MYRYITLITTLLLLLSLTACQQLPKSTSSVSGQDTSDQVAEMNVILTSITMDALKNQDYQQASRSIKAMILNDDKNSWGFIQSAVVSLPEATAIELINSTLNSFTVSNSPTQLFGISKILISFKKTEPALETINRSIELDPNNVDARYWRARLLTVMKEYEKAEKDFKFVLAKEPDNETYSGQYATFLQETKQFDKAQKILAQHKQTPDSLFKRIIFALQNEDRQTANELYQKLKALEVEEKAQNHKNFLTAESAYWLEKFTDSEQFYRQVTGGDHYLDARDMLSMILFDNQQYDDAIEVLHQLQNAEEKYAIKAYRLEAQIYHQQGDTDAALLTLSRSLEILPNNPELLYDRAMLYEQEGKMSQVEKDLLQIIKDDPKNYEALNALGYSLADHDLQLEKAHEYITRALKLSPENAAIIDSLGWVQYKLGQYQQAEASFQKALTMDIEDLELYIHLYKTLLKLNKREQAQQILNEAKTHFPDNEKLTALAAGKN